MVPYVRKSFFKHYKIGYKYLIDKDAVLDPQFADKASIDSEFYKELPSVYEYAMDMTVKEVKQSAEALFHNLNSLQSRSGNQLK
jgi:ribonucleoside-triphosphate reductase